MIQEAQYIWKVTQMFNVSTNMHDTILTPNITFHKARDFNELILQFKYIGNVVQVEKLGEFSE